MKARFAWGVLLASGALFLNSCGKKDPAPSAGVSFEVESEDTNESDGTGLTSFSPEAIGGGVGHDVNVKILFDKALSDKVVLTYTVTGTASKKNVVTGTGSTATTTYSDFYINGSNAPDTETLIVEAGATDATVKITVFEDSNFEVDTEDANGNYVETVVLTLTSIVSGPAQLGTTNLTNTLSIKEDDALFILGWKTSDGNTADLDFIAKTGTSVANGSVSNGTDGSLSTGGEGFAIPAGYPSGTYDLSYPYYSGTSNSVAFTVYMISNSNGTLNGKSYPYSSASLNTSTGVLTGALSFTGNYTLKNINKYVDDTNFTDVAFPQHMVKTGINYASISTIATLASGSRTSENSSLISELKSVKLIKLKDYQFQKVMKNLKSN